MSPRWNCDPHLGESQFQRLKKKLSTLWWARYPRDHIPVRICRSRVEEFLEELGRAAVGLGAEEGGRVRVLVTSHGGFIREMNLFLVRRFACSMPCQVCTDLLCNVCYGSRTTWKGQPQKILKSVQSAVLLLVKKNFCFFFLVSCSFDIDSREHAVYEPCCDFYTFCKPVLLFRFLRISLCTKKQKLFFSVVYFGTDPDPDQRIRTTDLQIQIRILLFSSVIFKMPTKIFFLQSLFAHYFLKVHLLLSLMIKSHEEVIKQKK
jgi:hypothetical protein